MDESNARQTAGVARNWNSCLVINIVYNHSRVGHAGTFTAATAHDSDMTGMVLRRRPITAYNCPAWRIADGQSCDTNAL